MSTEPTHAVAAAPRAPLTLHTRNALGVAATALALGALGDALLRPVPWGMNLTLWTLALIAASLALQSWSGTVDAATGWIPEAVVIAALLSWRDSPTLKALDLSALGVVLGLAIYRARGGSVRVAGLARYAAGLFESLGEAAFGAAPLVFRDVRWAELKGGGSARTALAAVRGVLIAVPLLLLFGSLLMAADAGFERLISGTFSLDLPLATSHLLLAATLAWIAGGVLRALVLPAPAAAERARPGGEPAPALKVELGIVELATVLGLLDVLFLAFVVMQLPHFFGSYATLVAPGTATFAEYARRGFFELCAVAGLALPLLLAAEWLLRKGDPRHERVFRVAAGTLAGLVFVIIASGLHRMRLYQIAYGLTELRVYTTAFMLWTACVLLWFCWTVLRGRRERFAFGAVTAAVETIILLHVANPDALIVRVNSARREAPVRFDALYAASLSGDAVPVLLQRLASVPADARCAVSARLRREWSGADEDWRAWSLGRARAVSAVRARGRELRAMCEPAVPPVAGSAPAAGTAAFTAPAPAPTTPSAAPARTASAAAASAEAAPGPRP